jgi:hypothetical protein
MEKESSTETIVAHVRQFLQVLTEYSDNQGCEGRTT